VHYCVLKNRLVYRALQELGIEGLDSLLEGPNAFVFGDKDVTAAPKNISTFIEKNKLTSLEIKGGLMGKEVMDVAAVKALAATPSRDELLATMVGCLVSPVSALVSVLEQIAEKKEAA
jgi:large subunit ribosomal protein L10